MGNGTESILQVANNALSTTVTVTTSGSDEDVKIVEDLKENVPSIENIILATIPPTPPPTSAPTFAPISCPAGQVAVYIRRVYGLYADEESFSLYEGRETDKRPIMTIG